MAANQPLNVFVVLFVVIDPIGTASVFAAMTRDMGALTSRRLAVRGVGIASSILIVFAFAGRWLLQALGVGIPAFRLAGGILLFLLAIDMVFARQSGLRSATSAEQREASRRQDVSVFPLAFPLIAGPGALTVILLLFGGSPPPERVAVTLALLVLVLALTLTALVTAVRLMRLLGATGANVLGRLFGVVLAALAMQFVLDGLRSVLRAG